VSIDSEFARDPVKAGGAEAALAVKDHDWFSHFRHNFSLRWRLLSMSAAAVRLAVCG